LRRPRECLSIAHTNGKKHELDMFLFVFFPVRVVNMFLVGAWRRYGLRITVYALRFSAKPPCGTFYVLRPIHHILRSWHYALCITPYALHSPPLILFLTTFLPVFTLYTLTLAPGVVGGDAGEHQLAVPLLGIPHTTGYPLYILAGKLWTLLIPIGPPAWRVNLFSAFGSALAAGLTALIVYYLDLFQASIKASATESQTSPPQPAKASTLPTTHHVPPQPTKSSSSYALRFTFYILHFTSYTPLWAGAWVTPIVLAYGLTLWQWSIVAGVRSFNIFFFALLTLQAIIWAGQRRQGQTQAAEHTLRWLAFTIGLSLAHHRTTLFYLPSLAAWVWWHDRRLILQPKRLLILALLTLAPLSLYLFTYLRGLNNPPYSHEKITDFKSFWFLVGSGDSTGLFLSIDPTYLPARLAFIGRDILAQLSWPGVILASLGALTLLWRYPIFLFFQSLLVLLLLLFTLDFEVVNLNEAPTWYLMPAYFTFAVWLGLGLNSILHFAFGVWDWLKYRINHHLPFIIHHSPFIIHHSSFIIQFLTAIAAVTIFTYSLGWPNWQIQYTAAVTPLDDWRQLLRGSQAQRFVESSLPYVAPGSIIWGDWEQYTPIKYYQLIHGLRPDLIARNPLDRWPEKVAAARAAGQQIYFTRKPADLIGTPYLTMAGPLIWLQTGPTFELPANITRLEANFENELELLGYRAQVWPQATPGGSQAGSILQLAFFWRIPQKVQWDYALSLRLLDAAGQEVYKKDAAHPVLSSYPTTLWTPGEVVGDFYELPLPPHAGPLTLHLLPYRTEAPGVWHNLTLTGTNPPQEGILLGPFKQ
jgi:hypothetical protein